MSNKRITDLTELTTPTTDDVFPVVDIATNTTTKVQLANLPVQTAVTTALATKQATLVSGTNIKTVNSNSLLGAGDVAVQETLVSGTNIKTLNSVSLLGAGNIVLAATPSGVAGAIQFSNGSAFASDATNLFWDDTNNRLGVGTNAPTTALHIVGQTTFSDNALFSADFKYIGREINNSSILFSNVGSIIRANISTGGQFSVYNSGTGSNRFAVSNGGQTTISGGGSTSATTSLLVQNSAGNTGFRVADDQSVGLYSSSQLCMNSAAVTNNNGGLRFLGLGSGNTYIDGWSDGTSKAQNYALFIGSRVQNGGSAIVGATTAENGTPVVFGSSVHNASALVQINSTTRGFLPPVMTTTQKNAIASPAAGLVVYDSTTNKLCCYNGSTWNDLF
jgi:hypothetical protein